jgi:hypothetical protein
MHFYPLILLTLTSHTVAFPITKRQAGAGPVLASTTYNAISISGGTAGNAEAEALAVFSTLDLRNPGNIDPADLDFLNSVNQVANKAEVGAFNPAIEAAAAGEEKDALQVQSISPQASCIVLNAE